MDKPLARLTIKKKEDNHPQNNQNQKEIKEGKEQLIS